jgi:hypothetical protein
MVATAESLFRGAIENLSSRVDLATHIAPNNDTLERERIFRRAPLT